jgi:hypothetical protein
MELKDFVGKRFETPRGISFEVIGWSPELTIGGRTDPECLVIRRDGFRPGFGDGTLAVDQLEKCREIVTP